jgi:peptidoglycan hydrolase CwlO-like protein
MKKLFVFILAGTFLVSSCGESKTKSTEKEEIEVMESTTNEVKESAKELEKQTEKVEEALERLDKEFKDTTD